MRESSYLAKSGPPAPLAFHEVNISPRVFITLKPIPSPAERIAEIWGASYSTQLIMPEVPT